MFFLDASGSCLNYSKRFFKLLKSIPEDKFKISAYSFDTNVYEIDLNGDKIKGSGGTSFQVINNEVENITKIRKNILMQFLFYLMVLVIVLHLQNRNYGIGY